MMGWYNSADMSAGGWIGTVSRFARGELDRDEYEDRTAVLRASRR